MLIAHSRAAQAYIERWTGRSLVVAAKTIYATDFARAVLLPVSPLVAVTGVTYQDPALGAPATLSASAYRVSYLHGPLPVLEFLDALTTLPAVAPGTVAIAVTHGYAEIPWDLIQAMIGLIGLWYGNVEAAAPVELRPVPFSLGAILEAYRLDAGLR